ncbi:hypothetical protein EI94DRAFT_1814142 [Lactarius quietus]|nr:hypothetical protein EI94DRAFT_1814142 [Lactarius quietus]
MVIEHDGRCIPAKYVRVRMLDNPEVFGTMGRYSPIYRADIHAEPCRDMGPTAEYSRDELQYFRTDFRGKHQVDEALARVGDISLQAEVRCYRASMEVVAELEAAIKKLEDDIYVHVDRAQHSATRLGRAHALRRVWDEHETDVGLTTVTNWVVERGRSPL